MRTLPLLALLAACGSPDTDGGAEPVDLRREFPAASAGAIVWDTPEYTIPAYTEQELCFIGTYTGDDVGIHAQISYQSLHGHHVALFGTTASERDFPDGTSWDCTKPEDLDMTQMEPIIIGGDIQENEEGVQVEFVLPDGMAAKLKSGQRYILQSHYVNTGPDPILVNDQMQLEVIPVEEVTTWSAPLVNTITDFVIPAGEMGYNRTFDCTFDGAYTVLYIGGHMHEWGTHFRTDLTRAGETSTIYEVPEWDPIFRDAPVYESYGDGEFVVQAGDVFTTSCTWDNDEDRDLEFPSEMCVTFGMIYPATVPVICEPG
jgi:hypothetical protein